MLRLMTAGFVGALALSCATIEYGTVAKRVNPEEARVYLGSQDVAVGDRVNFYSKNCVEHMTPASFDSYDVCEDLPIGSGTVTQVMDESSSMVQVDPGVKVAFGTIVKPATHLAH